MFYPGQKVVYRKDWSQHQFANEAVGLVDGEILTVHTLVHDNFFICEEHDKFFMSNTEVEAADNGLSLEDCM